MKYYWAHLRFNFVFWDNILIFFSDSYCKKGFYSNGKYLFILCSERNLLLALPVVLSEGECCIKFGFGSAISNFFSVLNAEMQFGKN